MKYVKLNNGILEFAPLNKGSILNYNKNTELLIQDGYKPLISTERPESDRHYKIQYVESENDIQEIVNYLESEEEYKTRKNNENAQSEIDLINYQIKEIDFKRIRAICEPEVKDDITGETWLDYYNAQILELRKKIQTVQERMKI